jgi:shikimate kinase
LNEITNAKNAVISLGGGTILNPENQKIIEKMSGIITYIYSDFETSISRIDLPTLPLLKNKNINEIEFLFNERKTKYFENSDLIISNNKTIIPALNKLYQEFS